MLFAFFYSSWCRIAHRLEQRIGKFCNALRPQLLQFGQCRLRVGFQLRDVNTLAYLWQHAQVRQELIELFDVLSERIPHVTATLARYDAVPEAAAAR